MRLCLPLNFAIARVLAGSPADFRYTSENLLALIAESDLATLPPSPDTEFGAAVRAGTAEYSCVEIWLDYLEEENQSLEQGALALITALNHSLKNRVLFLLRRGSLETQLLPPEVRYRCMEQIRLESGWLDLDIKAQPEDLQAWSTICTESADKTGEANLICSYHNYSETPPTHELLDILHAMKQYNPKIRKVSTYCNSRKDALRLMEILETERRSNDPLIVLGMGADGIATRIIGPLWDSYLMFAPPNSAASSANGQLTQPQLRSIFGVL